MFILLAVTVVQRTVGFGRGVLFGRWLSPEELGQWDLAYSFLLLAAPLAVLGVPGSFGRYAEHYRQKGQLHTFLKRTMWWTSVCSLAAVMVVAWGASFFSNLIFNSRGHADLTVGIAYCLGAIILNHTLIALLTAMRLYRVSSAMTFAQSMLFALIAIVLAFHKPTMPSILIGYGVACLVSSLGAMAWAWPGLHEIQRPQAAVAHSDFWPKLLRFAFFVWIANLLSHFFAITDRMMLVHYSGLSSEEATALVGQYHSSRIVPLLLISFADLLSGLLLPHLSSDWEAGRRENVSRRLNLTLKLSALGMIGFGVCLLLFSPFLFDVLFAGKYDAGREVMPWTMAGCVWFSLYTIAQCYLWCTERTRLAVVPLVWGVLVNVQLNLMLLPKFGLAGAVLATAIASLVCLLVTLRLNHHTAMQIDSGTWLVMLAPAVLGYGLLPASLTLIALLIAASATTLLIGADERALLDDLVGNAIAKYCPKRFSTKATS